MFCRQPAKQCFVRRPARYRRAGILGGILLLTGLMVPLDATDLAGTGPTPGSFIASGLDYEYNTTLGQAVRLFAGGQWQAASWLRILGGARFTTREAWPWTADPGDAGWLVYPDAQFAELVIQTPGYPRLDAGTRILRTGVPGSTDMFLSVSPYNTLDLEWIYARAGFSFRWWLDGKSEPTFEIQTLAHLGFRAFLAPDCYFRLEANTATDWESASFQSLGYELAFVFPLADRWQAQLDASLRPAGGVTMAATAYRVIAGLAIRMMP